jgi:hypothetical protein
MHFYQKKVHVESIIYKLIIETLYSNYYDAKLWKDKKTISGTQVPAGELIPLQFSKFITAKTRRIIIWIRFTPEQWERFSKFTEFKSMDGALHQLNLSGCSNSLVMNMQNGLTKNECWNCYFEQ